MFAADRREGRGASSSEKLLLRLSLEREKSLGFEREKSLGFPSPKVGALNTHEPPFAVAFRASPPSLLGSLLSVPPPPMLVPTDHVTGLVLSCRARLSWTSWWRSRAGF